MMSLNLLRFLLFHCLLPAAAECFDQGDGRDELLATQGGGGKFDVQGGALSGGDFEIGDEAVAVLIVNNLKLFTGGNEGVAFRGVLVGEKRLGGKVVFHLGEGRQHALAIGGDHFFVSRLRQAQPGAKFSAFKDRQGYGGSDSPETTRPIKQGASTEALEARKTVQLNGWEKGGLGDADAGVRRGHAPFGGGDIRSALQQLRRQLGRD